MLLAAEIIDSKPKSSLKSLNFTVEMFVFQFTTRRAHHVYCENTFLSVSKRARERKSLQCFLSLLISRENAREREKASSKLHKILREFSSSQRKKFSILSRSLYFHHVRLPCHCLFIRSTKNSFGDCSL